MPRSVVTFDVGQTLVDLDLDFLAKRLGQRGRSVSADALHAAAPAAWRRYDALTESGASHPWHELIETLLTGAGVDDPKPLADWLYEQQATHNLWRAPIPPMIDLVRELRDRGVATAALSNSEGHLADLLEEIELAPLFDAIVDSGRIGIAKPDPRIFALTLERLAIKPDVVVHIGDSWAADVEGALAAGWNAIWFHSRASAAKGDPRVPVARNADQTRAALKSFGV
jgi:FMN hydrolase / 5-amino-6-(5-phospho-D-ribitylamino)uracil phosphatase